MVKVRELLVKNLNENTVRAIVSNPRRKQAAKKIVFRPFLEKGHLKFQKEEYRNDQVFHENMEKSTVVEKICTLLLEDYKQLDLQCGERSFSVLVSKKGVSSIREHREKTIKKLELSHNRKKNYILDEKILIPFLVDLGVQTKEGKIVDKKYKKFRQINRFLEFIRDILPELKEAGTEGRPLRIIDFGCGKSYLTFAVYHYLTVINGMDVEMTGLDLKKDVIRHCSKLAEKYGYDKLHFSQGDIQSYDAGEHVDMVITLHACDTATDYALDQAVRWGAGVILSVPCCQHELNRQLRNEQLEPLLKYGILKERFSALLTDALRGNLLEQMGYEVQILEFIDLEHTPKNLLIRAVKSGSKNIPDEKEKQRYHELCHEMNSHITLEKLISGTD
ncbi:MAG: SAM-dependent methyltransferase [Roseburia sp.]|nr:SAM-dependent methyltransferase [Roseburia sp.]